ncbi:dTDP-4-dehydrorhamnose reductase [Frisingicoccus caecimuris]|uniref:dTDP-4-dehydrorhamnose reductase n=1 Tax=Frisingicoccus caecimuris TaxID=1796636 RepID=A0A4R2LAL7_9FIRM|nr:dTDP-4-dehydrorhamnose reductase [Frisingicoccus caecimuris]MCR1918786.1 dTDP-4-dehydrorhamnose reductase [Frisingicoccus caecimuris]TCO84413.1 dTDP-4-dehydrorhamnose reductase [Frisingicoccus caecimuris]
MKILVTGVKGQLGYDVVQEGEGRGLEMFGTDVDNMDITDAGQVKRVIEECKPDAVIHCAAYTAVDAAEDNQELCRKINVDGTRNIAEVCKDMGIPIMYFSTDYIFDGQGENFWKEDDPKKPLNVYGQTKYEGELNVQELIEKYFILRISWVFGVNGNNFIKTMLRVGPQCGEVGVVADQIGSPTYTYDLAKLVIDMIQTDKYGTYHVTNEGICSWYEFACEIFKQAGLDVKVNPLTTAEYPAKAARPFNSRMSKDKLINAGFKMLPSWQDGLKRYLNLILERGI